MKCSVCKYVDTTPKNAREHIEGWKALEVERACSIHGKYLDLPDIVSNVFSIEVIEILDNKK